MGRLDEARKAMRRSLELLPGNVQWLENLRAAEAALGNTAEAERLAAQIAQRKAGGKLTATGTEDVHAA